MTESWPIRKGRRPNEGGKLRRWPLALLGLLATGLLAAAGVSVYLGQSGMTGHAQLTSIAQTFVGQQIPEGYRPAFGPDEETAVEPAGDGKYRIQGWVDLIAADGTVEHQTFSCLIFKNTWGEWVSQDISLLPQEMRGQ